MAAGDEKQVLRSSFRDPSGFLFTDQGRLYRQVNKSYLPSFEACTASGLYSQLIASRQLVAHEEAPIGCAFNQNAGRVLLPEPIPFISYPYEWCHAQLRDAALLTLDIQAQAIEKGFSLKDASGYNVQFRGSEPVFIDTLSFEPYTPGRPWQAYRQFCQHFLLPLTLMSYCGQGAAALLASHIDGIPLSLGTAMLPKKALLRFGLCTHLFMHASAERKQKQRGVATKVEAGFSQYAFRALIDSLKSTVVQLDSQVRMSDWSSYYSDTNYTDTAMGSKERIVRAFIQRVRPKIVWDIGGNVGRFSRLAVDAQAYCVSMDSDAECIERQYRKAKEDGESGVLPLVQDLTNPSSALGWGHEERMSLSQRGPADLALCLAVVHHLCVAHNIPLPKVAEFLQSICRTLIIEFVPKEDSQLQRLLASREDIFDYTLSTFEASFRQRFNILERQTVADSSRVIFLMEALPMRLSNEEKP